MIWFLESHSKSVMYSAAAVLGLVLHQVFRRNEPTVYGFLGRFLGCNAGLTLICQYLGIQVGMADAVRSAFTCLTTLSVSLVLYRVFFHPLGQYPGPILCKITRFVASWHVYKRDSHEWIMKMHQKYGDAVRIAPNEVSFTSVSSVDLIHGSKAVKLARGPFYSGDPNRPADSMLSTRNLAEHRWRRRTWERAFGSHQLREFEPRVHGHLQVLVSQLKKRTGTTVDMTKWTEYFAYDVMSDLAFSEDFGMLAEGKPSRYISALHGATRLLTIAAQTPWVRPLMPYLPIDKESQLAGKEFGSISRATYERRVARTVKSPDMFEYITTKADGMRTLTEAERIADTSLLIAAGAVSTALTLAFLLYFLACNRSQLEKLQAEIDRCWDGKVPLEVGTLEAPNAAPFLHGAINESLRLWPAAPNGMQRQTPAEGIVVDGEFVAPNTQVSVHTMTIQRDERYFSKPNEFIPERWIDEDRPLDFLHDSRAFIPFTIGQYACLGKNLAYQEMRLFMAYIVRNFNFGFSPEYNVGEFERNIFFKGTFLIGPLPLVFTARAYSE